MECWGLILFTELELLLDEDNSLNERQFVAMQIGCELAKQWIGNLVTMEWWTHVWLKEGFGIFAKFFSMEAMGSQGFDIWTNFVTNVVLRALKVDSLKFTHPVEMYVFNPAEIEEAFDDVTARKGAAILRMLNRYLGDKNFHKGLAIYMEKYQYKNATTEDFWKCFEEASSRPVAAMMNCWSRFKGYPAIKIESRQIGKNRILKLSQERFVNDPSGKEQRNALNSPIWVIPLIITTGDNPDGVAYEGLMDSRTQTIMIPDISKQQWIKARLKFPKNLHTTLFTTITIAN